MESHLLDSSKSRGVPWEQEMQDTGKDMYNFSLFLLKYPVCLFFFSRSVPTLPLQPLLLTASLSLTPKLIRFFSVFSLYEMLLKKMLLPIL